MNTPRKELTEEKTKELIARRDVVEKLIYRLIEVTSIVNDDVGEDLSYIELAMAFSMAQQLLVKAMESREEE